MSYEVICSNCNAKGYEENLTDFSSIRCNKCNSLKFGLKNIIGFQFKNMRRK